MKQLAAAEQKGEYSEVRRIGEELLAGLEASAPSEIRYALHYLIGDSILRFATLSEADLGAATDHFQTYVDNASDPANARNIGHAFIKIGRAQIRRGKADQPGAFERAIAAFDRARNLLPEEAEAKLLAEAYTGLAEAHEFLAHPEFKTLNAALVAYKSAYRLFGGTKKLNEGVVAFRMGRIEIRLFDLSGDRALLQDALGHLEQAEVVYRVARQDSELEDALKLLSLVRKKLGLPDLPTPQAQPVLPQRYKLTRVEPPLPQAELEHAMDYIRRDDLRRIYLGKFLDHHTPADAERAEFLLNHVILPLESEIEAMRQAAIERGDAELLKRADETGAMAIEHAERLLKRDRECSTHAEAVDVLRDHLERGKAFILFLRSFDLEIAIGRLPKDRERAWLHEDYGFNLIQVGTTVLQRCILKDKIGSALATSCHIIEVSYIGDALDTNPSRSVSRLRVLSAEWQLVVSMLVGQASSVVVFASRLTAGVFRELELIKRLACEEKTTVLMIEPDDNLELMVDSLGESDLRLLAYDVLQHALEMGFPSLAEIRQLTDSNIQEMADRIRSQVAHGNASP
jgi:tetratricopeptide (TPR) repeat protein